MSAGVTGAAVAAGFPGTSNDDDDEHNDDLDPENPDEAREAELRDRVSRAADLSRLSVRRQSARACSVIRGAAAALLAALSEGTTGQAILASISIDT